MRRLIIPALLACTAFAPRAQPVSFVADGRAVTCQTPEQIHDDGEVPLTLGFAPDGTLLSMASHGDAPMLSAASSVAFGCTAARVGGRVNQHLRVAFRFDSTAQTLAISEQLLLPVLDTDVYEFSDVSPVLIGGIGRFQSRIVYPDDAQSARIQGRVIVRFVVERDGSTSTVQVVRSVYLSLDVASVQAIREARFEPGRNGNGQAVRTRQTLPVTFAIR